MEQIHLIDQEELQLVSLEEDRVQVPLNHQLCQEWEQVQVLAVCPIYHQTFRTLWLE